MDLPEREKKRILAAQRKLVRKLKLTRKFNDKQARRILIAHYKKNNNKWDSNEARKQFSRLMDSRWTIHERLVRFQGEKKNPEFDSP